MGFIFIASIGFSHSIRTYLNKRREKSKKMQAITKCEKYF